MELHLALVVVVVLAYLASVDPQEIFTLDQEEQRTQQEMLTGAMEPPIMVEVEVEVLLVIALQELMEMEAMVVPELLFCYLIYN
jgi:hypothetical protein